MSLKAVVDGYTAWSNVRLVKGDCEATDILDDIMRGSRMKILLREVTGHTPGGLDSLDKLTTEQKVTRVHWFIDALNKSGKLPGMKVDSKMFSLSSADHVLPVLWELVRSDVLVMWEIASLFQQRPGANVVIASPLEIGPCKITKDDYRRHKTFYLNADGKSVADIYKRKCKNHSRVKIHHLLIQLVNDQLKLTVGGRRLYVKSLKDLVDSRVLCALVNSLIPGSFTSDVLLNDRWTVNLVLDTASKVFRVTSPVDCHDLHQNDKEGICTFLTYFFIAGYQYRQAEEVTKKVKELTELKEGLFSKLKGQKVTDGQNQVKGLETQLSAVDKELEWIYSVYNYEECKTWMEHADKVQAEIRNLIARKMAERFDVVTVPQTMSVKMLAESMFINLSLTGGIGFYLSNQNEKLWTERKIVIRDMETGEYLEDFSGSKNRKDSVRSILNIHPSDVVIVQPVHYPKLELFFESPSRNRILKVGTKFLYQIFPGTTGQCERLLLRASSVGEITAVKKLIIFFNSEKQFVNCMDHSTGNTALHLASRHGHFNIALHLLENGAEVNLQNRAGCTPFFLSSESLHKGLSQLLLEWGADIHIKNRISKKALELTRNVDFREFLEGKYEEYCELSFRLMNGDVEFLENYLKAHLSKENPIASLRSRCVDGNTLFHQSALLASKFGIETFFAEHIDINIQNANGATPLHVTRDPVIIQLLIDHSAAVNHIDMDGNTALHLLCSDKDNIATIIDCINILVSNHAQVDIPNQKGWLPIHCAASNGLTSAIETLLTLDEYGSMDFLKENSQNGLSSLVFISLVHHHFQCAVWLASNGYTLKQGEADGLLSRILKNPEPLSEYNSDILDTVSFLLEYGANPNMKYAKNNRPLHLSAAIVSIPELSKFLLRAGAEVDARNFGQETPLFAACKANNPFVAKMLIEKGADCNAQDSRGKCAFDYLKDHEEWIDSGYFSDNIRALLKAFSLRHARDLVRSICKTIQTK